MDSVLSCVALISEQPVSLQVLLLLGGFAIIRRIRSITIRFGDERDR